MLDGELLAVADRELAQRSSRLDVVRVFLGHPVPERVAVGTGRSSGNLLPASSHGRLLVLLVTAGHTRTSRPRVRQAPTERPRGYSRMPRVTTRSPVVTVESVVDRMKIPSAGARNTSTSSP